MVIIILYLNILHFYLVYHDIGLSARWINNDPIITYPLTIESNTIRLEEWMLKRLDIECDNKDSPNSWG